MQYLMTAGKYKHRVSKDELCISCFLFEFTMGCINLSEFSNIIPMNNQ